MLSRSSHAIREFLARSDEGRRIGPFQLLKQLGRGGFAPVWLAKEIYGDTEFREVAIKLFCPEPEVLHYEGSNGLDVILQEARALCSVEHPNVVRFYTLVSDEATQILGLAMEYVRGRS